MLVFKLALRSLLKSPAFAISAVVTLALGIGVCTTMFSVVETVILRPLPVVKQDELVIVWQTNAELGIEGFGQSVPNFFDYREGATTLAGALAMDRFNANVALGDRAVRLRGAAVTSGFTDVLGWTPLAGRAFLPSEDEPGAARVVMISSDLWQENYQRDPAVVGTTMHINGEPHEIIGVLDSGSALFEPADIWRPLALDRHSDDRDNHLFAMIARLKPGVTLEQAQSELQTIGAGFPRSNPDYIGWSTRLESLYDVLVPPKLRSALVALFAAVGCVLLIACANVANLLLARAFTQQQEISVRLALGASWRHVLQHVFSQTALLAIGGTLGGIVLALWGVSFLRLALPADMRGVEEIAVDGPSLAFAAGACVIVTLLAGILPAVRSARGNPASVLSGGTRTIGATPDRQRARSALMVFQFALCTVLLVAAGLLLRNFARLQAIDPGFTASGLLSFKISPDQTQYGDEQPRLAFYQTIVERLKSLPGVTHVGISSGLPLDISGRTGLNLFPIGSSALPAGESVQAHWRIVSEEYFATLQIPVRAGRAFTQFDSTEAEPVIIISEKLAERFWPGEDAVGKQVDPGGGGNLRTVVGVVRDIHLRDLTGDSWPAMYLPLSQWWGWNTMSVVLRTTQPAESLAAHVRSIMREIDPAQPIYDLRTVENVVSVQLQPARLNSSLLTVFGGVALILAAVGIFGVMAARVAERRSEIGVRIALGADTGHILRLVLGQGLRLAAIGLAAGLLTAFATTRVFAAMLYDTPAADPLAYIGTAALLGGTALAACWLPARRAAAVDPIEALRAE